MRSRTGVRTAAVCLLLIGLCFIQDPGYLVSDTKFDLAVAPGQFLERALHLWDAQGAFGQLQNQAYGYLWPMGPFFVLFHALDVPGWIVQRLWQALVMCVGFVGVTRVARALGVRSDVAALTAGLAFALSPRMLTVLGPISIEAWPSALAPWVLLPLIRGSTAGSPRRAAALSALAVAMVGGVNAAATFAVLPLGVVWLLTRTRGPRRRSLMIWWPTFTLLGTLWWLVPLFVMGKYSPPFLDFIESTSVTTFPTTIFDSLRGTSNWVPYVSSDSRAGNDLLTIAALSLNSGLVLLGGFAGLLDRRNQHRLFLALSLLVGMLMVGAGHHGAVQGLFTDPVRDLLDGALAPLRNVHKYDPVIRLPLVIGLAMVVDRVTAGWARADRTNLDLQGQLERINRGTVLAMIGIGLVGSMLPAWAARIEPAFAVASVPTYWQQAASYLEEHPGGGTALLAPGSGFGTYLWGSPKDEPLQFLTSAPWAVRNAIPLAPTGNIRMLDAIEDRFAQGEGSPGLAEYLQRSGVGYLVVRNDLRQGSDVPEPVLVHQALDQSPGITRVATFGPKVGGGAHLFNRGVRTVINGGWQSEYPAIEVYRVGGSSQASSGSDPTVVVGGPEDLLGLEDLRVIGTEPTVLAPDVSRRGVRPPSSPYVLTDGLRERERFYGRLHDAYSAVLTPGDEPRGGNPTLDYLSPGDERWLTRARLSGARALSASSSGSDSDTAGGSRRGELPYAAVDGSQATEWVSNPARGGRPWWQIDLDRATDVRTVAVTAGASADDNQVVRVRTQNGTSQRATAGPGETVRLQLPPGRTRWIRVESPTSNTMLLSLAEVDFPGLAVQRQLVLPRVPESWGNPRDIVLRADLDDRRGCVEVDRSIRCAQGKDRPSEEAAGMARRFTLPQQGTYAPTILVRPRAGAALDALITRQQPVNVSASSMATPDPRGSPIAAVDGDPATTWISNSTDLLPTIRLNWIGKRSVTGIHVALSQDVAARRPTELTLIWPGGRKRVTLDEDGKAKFAPIRTSQLTVQVRQSASASNLDFERRTNRLGAGIQELRLTGVPLLPTTLSTKEITAGCGSGPVVRLNGTTFQTSVTATPAELFAGKTVPASLCAPGSATADGGKSGTTLSLLQGRNDLRASGADAFDVESVVLHSPGSVTAPGASHEAATTGDSPVRTEVQPSPGDSIVDLGQNENPGWEATQGDRSLRPVVLNGWQQGWLLHGDQRVVATYGPDGLYRVGLAAGLVCLLLLFGYGVVIALRRHSGDDSPPLAAAGMPGLVAHVLAAGGAVLLAGWAGLVVAACVFAVVALLRRRAPEVLPWVLASACFVASFAYWVHPWTDPSGWAGDESWPHYVALVPVLAAVVLAGREPRRSFRRMQGASTKR